MKTHTSLVGAAFALVAATASSLAFAQDKPAAAPADKPAAATADKPDDKAAPKAPVKEEEGPFAPKGKTGKLRDQAEAEPAEAAEPTEQVPVEPKKRGYSGLDFVFGFGTMGTAAVSNKTTVGSFVVGTSYLVTPKIQLGMRIPFTMGGYTATDTSPKDYKATAFGNLTVNGAYVVKMSEQVELPIGLAIAAPTAAGDPVESETNKGLVRKAEVNALAQYARGFEADELFASHRLGLVPGAGLDYRSGAARVSAFTRVPVLIKASGRSEPATQDAVALHVRTVAIEWVVGGQGYYGVIPQLEIGARAWITTFIRDAIGQDILPGGSGLSPVQFVLEPSVLAKIKWFRGGLGFIWPIGGRAGSDIQMNGLRLTAGGVY